MTHKILVLWSTPRSTSTAFEWMMRQRGDFICHHEPFGPAYYRGVDRRTTRPDENPLEPDVSYASVLAMLDADAARGPVFSKDMSNYIVHMADGDFLDRFQHTFLIRHPALVLPSMHAQWPSFTLEETSFAHQHQLFDLVAERYGEPAPVINSDDLLGHPERAISAYCDVVGIPFIPRALHWDEGDREEVTWYGGGWHDNLKGSTGIGHQQTDYAKIEDVPLLGELYEQCLPHYEALYPHRIRLD